jgi:hypothetical protein
MLRIKVTPMGGYVLGDGDCPFEPDDFLKIFGKHIIQAQMQGLTEIGIPDEEVKLLIAQTTNNFNNMVDVAEVHAVDINAVISPEQFDTMLRGEITHARNLLIKGAV